MRRRKTFGDPKIHLYGRWSILYVHCYVWVIRTCLLVLQAYHSLLVRFLQKSTFRYGSILIVDEGMGRGEVFTVFFAVMSGSTSIGMAAPHLTAMATAAGAAATIMEIIDAVSVRFTVSRSRM